MRGEEAFSQLKEHPIEAYMRSEAGIETRIEALLTENVEAAIEREERSLDELLTASNRRIVLVGAGSTGRRALTSLRSIGVAPLGIVDNDPNLQGGTIEDTPIMTPAEAANLYGRDAVFVIAIWNAKHWYADTFAQLSGLGCRNVVPIGPVYWRFRETFLPFFVQDLPHKVFVEKGEALRASAIWSDEQSRMEYYGHLRWRTHGEVGSLPSRPVHESYFADDIFDLRSDEAFVDCGAYDGDTIRSFLARRGDEFRSIEAIEPSPETFEKLTHFVSALAPPIRQKVRLVQCALGAESGTARFDASRGVDSQISDSGGVTVPLRTLDELCDGLRPTYVKMDIEGAEFDTLVGATELIRTQRPVLAICLEHYQNDLWKLPLFVHDMLPDYSMFLRTYEGDGWQSVCYAVHPDRRREQRV